MDSSKTLAGFDIVRRNNVVVRGCGTTAMLFAHGFGCDQYMWRFVAPAFESDHRTVLFDHVGAGKSDLNAYHKEKYSTLDGYANDIIDICDHLGLKDTIYVGHSVSAIIGIKAAVKRPDLFKHLILVAPSPSYINDGSYTGGFTRPQIDDLLESLDNNHFGWSMAMAPVIMANSDRKDLSDELANSFCRTDPEIAKQFARATFLTDERGILDHNTIPSLILQCSEDIIAPVSVGDYMHEHLAHSTLVQLKATGHCPNVSAPDETISAIKEYLSHDFR
jgi:sigma-B regulation protein RsbQ